MAYIFVTKLSYLATPEFQVTDRPGSWSDTNDVYYSLEDALRAGLFNNPTEKIKVKTTEFVDFAANEEPIVKTHTTELSNLIKS